MKEKIKKRDLIVIVFLLILLMGVLVVSGIFYFGIIKGDFGTTGHVVINTNNELNNPSSKIAETRILSNEPIEKKIAT